MNIQDLTQQIYDLATKAGFKVHQVTVSHGHYYISNTFTDKSKHQLRCVVYYFWNEDESNFSASTDSFNVDGPKLLLHQVKSQIERELARHLEEQHSESVPLELKTKN